MSNKQVLRWQDGYQVELQALLGSYGLTLSELPEDAPITGSFWGEDEAGLVGNKLYLRPDTPIHSILHEACHWICMDDQRRAGLHTNAGGNSLEECAVCYLQVLLAGKIGIKQHVIFANMDSWGYSFRLGRTERWFHEDADDARDWLGKYDLIDEKLAPTGAIRSRKVP